MRVYDGWHCTEKSGHFSTSIKTWDVCKKKTKNKRVSEWPVRKTNVSPAQVVISSMGLFLPQTLTQGYTPSSGVLMMPVWHRETASTCSSNITAVQMHLCISHVQADSTLAHEQSNQTIEKNWHQEYSFTVIELTINKPTARSPTCNKYTSFASLHCKSMFQVGYMVYLHFKTIETQLCKM